MTAIPGSSYASELPWDSLPQLTMAGAHYKDTSVTLRDSKGALPSTLFPGPMGSLR